MADVTLFTPVTPSSVTRTVSLLFLSRFYFIFNVFLYLCPPEYLKVYSPDLSTAIEFIESNDAVYITHGNADRCVV